MLELRAERMGAVLFFFSRTRKDRERSVMNMCAIRQKDYRLFFIVFEVSWIGGGGQTLR